MRRIDLPADQFRGGLGHRSFTACERFVPGPVLLAGQRSESRRVVSLTGAQTPGNAATVTFGLEPEDLPQPQNIHEYRLRVNGMWDHLSDIGPEWVALHNDMPTFGRFEIELNGQKIFDDLVFFWNYRQWRFWPSFELPVPAAILGACNSLRIRNLTRPFFEMIPDRYRPFFPTAFDPDQQRNIPAGIRDNTTFHLSDCHLLIETLHDLRILNLPRIACCGELFAIEIHALGQHDLKMARSSPARPLDGLSLEPGRNRLRFQIDEPAGGVAIHLESAQTHAAIDLIIEQVVPPRAGPELALGHLIGGHRTAFAIGHQHDYLRAVELFKDTRQGNLVGWIISPRKAGEHLRLEQLPIEMLRRSELRVVFRYNPGLAPEPCFAAHVRELAQALESQGVGLDFAPHELGGRMGSHLSTTVDRPVAYRAFVESVRMTFDQIRRLSERAGLWVTDPSLYADIYCRLGASRPGIELFPLNCNLNIASARGAARTYGKDTWAAINSFECQAWGGLDLGESASLDDPAFDQKRQNLWWLSLFHTYLSGSRLIYSESGFLGHAINRHHHFEDVPMRQFREAQTELVDFAKLHQLPAFPQVSIAYVKADDEVFADRYAPPPARVTSYDLTWHRVRAALPNIRWYCPALQSMSCGTDDRIDYADTPFGPIDLIALGGPERQWPTYCFFVLVGRHALKPGDIERLKSYVTQGGELMLSLYDLCAPDAPFPRGELESLFGPDFPMQQDAPDEGRLLREIAVPFDRTDVNLSGLERPFRGGKGAYGEVEMAPMAAANPQDVVLRDRWTETPLLVRRAIGKGVVWFWNVKTPPADARFHQLVADVLRRLFQRLPLPVRLVSGNGINHFIYSIAHETGDVHHGFAVKTDWHPDAADPRAVFAYGSLQFEIQVPARIVRPFCCIGGFVVVPGDPMTRIDPLPADRNDGRVALNLTGPGTSECELFTREPVDSVEITLNGAPAAVRLRRLDATRYVFGATLRGNL